MNDNDALTPGKPARRPPWNKGKIIGAKPLLRQGHVWSIRTRLQLEKRFRDLGGCWRMNVQLRGWRSAQRAAYPPSALLTSLSGLASIKGLSASMRADIRTLQGESETDG